MSREEAESKAKSAVAAQGRMMYANGIKSFVSSSIASAISIGLNASGKAWESAITLGVDMGATYAGNKVMEKYGKKWGFSDEELRGVLSTSLTLISMKGLTGLLKSMDLTADSYGESVEDGMDREAYNESLKKDNYQFEGPNYGGFMAEDIVNSWADTGVKLNLFGKGAGTVEQGIGTVGILDTISAGINSNRREAYAEKRKQEQIAEAKRIKMTQEQKAAAERNIVLDDNGKPLTLASKDSESAAMAMAKDLLKMQPVMAGGGAVSIEDLFGITDTSAIQYDKEKYNGVDSWMEEFGKANAFEFVNPITVEYLDPITDKLDKGIADIDINDAMGLGIQSGGVLFNLEEEIKKNKEELEKKNDDFKSGMNENKEELLKKENLIKLYGYEGTYFLNENDPGIQKLSEYFEKKRDLIENLDGETAKYFRSKEKELDYNKTMIQYFKEVIGDPQNLSEDEKSNLVPVAAKIISLAGGSILGKNQASSRTWR